MFTGGEIAAVWFLFPFNHILATFQSRVSPLIAPGSVRLQAPPGRSAWSSAPVVAPVAASSCAPMEIEALPRSPGGEKRRLVPEFRVNS